MLGDLAPIMAIGLRAVLEEDGIDVIGLEREPERIVVQAERLQPDVVGLAVDKDGARALGEQIQLLATRSKVILWARDETGLEVLETVSRTPLVGAITGREG